MHSRPSIKTNMANARTRARDGRTGSKSSLCALRKSHRSRRRHWETSLPVVLYDEEEEEGSGGRDMEDAKRSRPCSPNAGAKTKRTNKTKIKLHVSVTKASLVIRSPNSRRLVVQPKLARCTRAHGTHGDVLDTVSRNCHGAFFFGEDFKLPSS